MVILSYTNTHLYKAEMNRNIWNKEEKVGERRLLADK